MCHTELREPSVTMMNLPQTIRQGFSKQCTHTKESSCDVHRKIWVLILLLPFQRQLKPKPFRTIHDQKHIAQFWKSCFSSVFPSALAEKCVFATPEKDRAEKRYILSIALKGQPWKFVACVVGLLDYLLTKL